MLKSKICSILISLSAILFSPNTSATDKVYGHPEPLGHELLKRPIKLRNKCSSISIKEWTGGNQTKAAINSLNAVCNKALTKWPVFIAQHYDDVNTSKKLVFNISLIPDTREYRGLNDISFRFNDRNNDVWGYTSLETNWMWIISESDEDVTVEEVFAHELFHAMSIYYGTFERHPGNKYQRIRREEYLADKFTEELLIKEGS